MSTFKVEGAGTVGWYDSGVPSSGNSTRTTEFSWRSCNCWSSKSEPLNFLEEAVAAGHPKAWGDRLTLRYMKFFDKFLGHLTSWHNAVSTAWRNIRNWRNKASQRDWSWDWKCKHTCDKLWWGTPGAIGQMLSDIVFFRTNTWGGYCFRLQVEWKDAGFRTLTMPS